MAEMVAEYAVDATGCIPMRACTRCGEEKPETREFFSPDKRFRLGLSRWCKACRNEHQRMRNKVNGRAEWWAAYYAANRDAVLEKNRRWATEHPEDRRRHARERRKRPEVRAADRLRDRERFHRDPAGEVARGREWRRRNREAFNASQRARYARDVARHRAYCSNRRALRVSATGLHTAADVVSQYNWQNGLCYWCMDEVGGSYHVDHVIPLSRGGSNGPENIVVSCSSCNTSRGAKLPDEWDREWLCLWS